MSTLGPSLARNCAAMSFVVLSGFWTAGCSTDSADTDEAVPTEEATSQSEAALETSKKEQGQLAQMTAEMDPKVHLGMRLFHDNRLSNPGANLASSCRTCHVPPEVSGGARNFADPLPLSVIPSNERGSKQHTLRNTPSLQDVTLRATFHADGRFDSLDATLRHVLASTHMGWMPGEEDRASDEIFALLLNDTGEDPIANGSYLEEFNAAKGVDIESLSRDEALDLVIASLTDYLATIKTHNTSSYDAMAYLNRFNEGLANEYDRPEDLSGRIFGRIANQEGRVLIRFPNVYDEEKYQGLKTFMRVIPTWSSSVEGTEENIGNCIACHIPPKFTDDKFHNIGVTQMDYDAEHGEGAFAGLDVASAEAIDLGRWQIDPQDENIAAFRTPMLRNPAGSDPYMHNGAYATLEDAVRQHIAASELAKAGKLRNAPPELMTMNLSDDDLPQLVAFLQTLNEVPEDEYRDFRIQNVRIRQDPMGEQTYDN